MDKFTQFKQEIEKLHHLLQDEQSELFSERQLLNERMRSLTNLYYGKSVLKIKTNISQVEVNDENDYTLENGEKTWRNKKDQIHRDNDQPAIIHADGTQTWCKEGQIHRDNDKPAVIFSNGTQYWYKEGLIHRDNDQPAVIHADGTKDWYKEDQFHRDNDKPARIYADGSKSWYKEGLLHRDNDKPAIILADGTKYWYKEGVDYIPSSTKKLARKNKKSKI